MNFPCEVIHLPPIIPQIIGLLAVASFLWSYQLKERKHIIAMNVVARVLYIFQYLLLGAFSGAILDVLGAASAAIAGRRHTGIVKKHARAIFITINIAMLVTGLILVFLSRNPIDLLPLAGVLLHTIALWIEDERIIRRISLAGSPFWFSYNLLSRAYGAAIGDVLTMTSIVIAMFKYRKKK